MQCYTFAGYTQRSKVNLMRSHKEREHYSDSSQVFRKLCLWIDATTHVKCSHLVASLPTIPRQQVVFSLLVPSCQQVWNNLILLTVTL
jgi:hypothetical protein